MRVPPGSLHLDGIQVKFVYEGYRVKVKVTERYHINFLFAVMAYLDTYL